MAKQEEQKRRPHAPANGSPANASSAAGDTAVEERSEKPRDAAAHTTVVGIGASTGGLGALRRLFRGVSADSGLAYVVVVHLSPDHPSHLAELLQPDSSLPVQQINGTVKLEPNRVYVIPPNANLSAVDTHLRLSELEERRNDRAPIDHFFRTLSNTRDGHAVGVILTGTGSDGTLGLKEIKAKGGLAVVQDPNEAEYDGMPQSAIASGMVDLVLPLDRIPEALLRFARTEPRVEIPADEEGGQEEERHALQKIFAQLRARTGRDFSRYKRPTVLRRIARRMQIMHVVELEEYLETLRESSEEVVALANDLLISVTSFFRDPEVFDALERDVIPKLFAGKGPNEDVRVWSVGCATGEEAYSLAILLLEEAARHQEPPRVQVFASDLHELSLERAREGFYPGEIDSEIRAERLRRFFTKEPGGYRVRKEVREIVVFAPHNVLADPPFSRLDLISCRNLLIYLQRDVQRDVIELFHYALRPDGHLVLGSAEIVEAQDLFRLDDKQHRVYSKRNVPVPEPRLPVFPVKQHRIAGLREARAEAAEPVAYASTHQRMVDQYGPPSLLVNANDRVVHLSQRAGRYLVHPGGALTSSVLKLVREELRSELRSALHTARREGAVCRSKAIPVAFDGSAARVVIDVRVSPEPGDDGFALVLFEERPDRPLDDDADPAAGTTIPDDSHLREMGAELDRTRQRLQAIIEEYETSQEEMKASNEELQSANEELRCTMEELETSKEELQSMHEELQTLNQENRRKVEELAQLSSDLQNLMAATDIATLFLDRDLRILRFTPKVGEIFNVRLTDRGRPLSDLTHRLGYDGLGRDATQVLDELVPTEREVQDDEGRWYLTRTRPYRSTQDRAEGVVITFVDITDRKRAGEELRRSEEFHRRAVDAAHVGTWDFALDSGRASLSEQKARLLGLPPHETNISHQRMLELTHPDDRSRWEAAIADSKERGKPFELEFRILVGREVHWLRTKGRLAEDGDEHHLYGASIDITALKRAEAALGESERQYKTLFESIKEGFCVMEVLFDEHERPVDARWLETNPAFELHTGLVDAVGKRAKELVPDQRPFWIETYGRIALTGKPKQLVEESPAVGRWFEIEAFRVGEPRQRRVALLVRDITERRRQEEELRRANEMLEQQVDARARQVGEQEERFRRLVESAAQVTWTADSDGNVTADSSLWQEFTGQQPEATENGRWLKMIHPDDRAELVDGWARAVEERGSFEYEARVRHAASGAYRWMTIRAVPLPSETGEARGWFGMGLDIDELKRAEERIRTMAGKLTAAERHERQRIAQLLHDDLQQVLYSIQMKLQLAREKQEEGGAVGALLGQVDWSLGMLEEAIAKTRHLTIDLSPPLLAGEGIVAALRWLRAPMRDLHRLDVELDGDDSIGAASEDVANLVFQVVRELLFNVAKHSGTDRAVIHVERAGDRVRVTVSDEGVGFDVGEARLEHDDETAFGLLSARERLRLRGGDLEIDSEPGRGTRVVVYAPGFPKS